MLSDPSGHFEAIVFSGGCSSTATCWSPAAPCCSSLQAGLEGDEVRARIQTAERLDEAAAQATRRACASSCATDDADRQPSQSACATRGEGEVSLVLILDDGDREVEVKLPGRYQVSPQIAGALRAAPGVVHVEMS